MRPSPSEVFGRVGLAVLSLFMGLPTSVWAAPTGAEVIHGQVQIMQQGAQTTIHASDRAVINYAGFNIQAHEAVRFIQPGSQAWVLNRVLSDMRTEIRGALRANGRVMLVNPAGVYFGPNSIVDVNRLVASSLNISNDSFLSNEWLFEGGEGALTLEGDIRAEGVALIGRQIINNGNIVAPGGMVVMAAGERVLMRDPDEHLYVEVDGKSLEEVREEAASPEAVKDGPQGTAIENSGTVEAKTTLLMVGDMYSQAFTNLGSVVASVTEGSDEGGQVEVAAASGRVTNRGSIEAKSGAEKGGRIRTDSPELINRGTMKADGGEIGIYGNALAQAGTIEANTENGRTGRIDMISTERTIVVSESLTRASGRDGDGDGGTVIFNSLGEDSLTDFQAGSLIDVSAGALGGDGGFAEVSGRGAMRIEGMVQATASHGESGEFFIDPVNLTIIAGGISSLTPSNVAGQDDSEILDGALLSTELVGQDAVISQDALEALAGGLDITLEITNGSITVQPLYDGNSAPNTNPPNDESGILDLQTGAGRTLTFRATGGNPSFNFQNTNDTIRTAGGNIIISFAGAGITSSTGTLGRFETNGGDFTARFTGGVTLRPVDTQSSAIAGGTINIVAGTITFDAHTATAPTDPQNILAGDIDLNADAGNITIAAPSLNVTAAGSVNISAASGFILFTDNNLTAGGQVQISGQNGVTIGDLSQAALGTGGSVTITSTQGDITVNDSGTGAGEIANIVGDGVTLSSSGTVTIEGNIDGNANASGIQTGQNVSVQAAALNFTGAAGNSITDADIIILNGASAGQGITVSTGGPGTLTLTGNTLASDPTGSVGSSGVTMNSVTALSLNLGTSIGGTTNPFNGNFTITNATGTITAAVPATTVIGNINWSTSNNVAGALNISNSNITANNIALAASGASSSINFTNAGLTVSNGGNLALTQGPALNIGVDLPVSSIQSGNTDQVNLNVTTTATTGTLTFSAARTWNALTGAAGGNLTVSADQQTDSGGIALSANGALSVSGDLDTSTPNQAISLTADVDAAGGGNLTVNAGRTVNSGGGALDLRGAEIELNGSTIRGTGALSLSPSQTNGSVTINGGASDVRLSTNDLAALRDGFSLITIGRADSTGGTVATGGTDTTFADPLTVRGSTIDFNDAITLSGAGDALSLYSQDSTTISGNLSTNAGLIQIFTDENNDDTGSFTHDGGTIGSGGADISISVPIISAGATTLLLSETVVAGANINAGAGQVSLEADEIDINDDHVRGTGTLVIRPSTDNTIDVSIGNGGAAGSLNLTTADIAGLQDGFTGIEIGVAGDERNVTVDSAVTFEDDILVRGVSISVNSASTVTVSEAGGRLALSATGDLTVGANLATTTAGPIILTADSDGGGASSFTQTAGTINSAGGNIDVTVGDTDSGLGSVNVRTINAGAGNLTILSRGGVIQEQAPGLSSLTGANISLQAGATIPGNTRIGSSTDAINIAGGTVTTATAGTGGIFIDSTAATTLNNMSIVGGSGNIEVALGAGLQLDVNGAINAGAGGNVVLEADEINLDSAGGATVTANTGTVTLRPATASLGIQINTGDNTGGELEFISADLDALQDGFNSITIGRTDGTGAITVDAPRTFNDPLVVLGGSITVGNTLTMGTNSLTLTSRGALNVNDLTTTNANISLTADADGSGDNFTFANGTISTGAGSGNISITVGDTTVLNGAGNDGVLGLDNATLDAGTGDITLQADEINLTNGSKVGSTTVQPHGTLSLAPTSADLNINFRAPNDADANALDLTDVDLGAIQAGFNEIIIGRTGSTGTLNLLGTLAILSDPVSFLTGNATIPADIGTGGQNFSVTALNDLTVNASITSAGGNVALVADADGDGTGTFQFNGVTGTRTINAGSGNILIEGAEINLVGDDTVTGDGTGTLTLRPGIDGTGVAATGILVGAPNDGSANLDLTAADLDAIAIAGFSAMVIGVVPADGRATGAVSIDTALTANTNIPNGPLSVYGGNLNVGSAINMGASTANALALTANETLTVAQNITATGANITLAADADGDVGVATNSFVQTGGTIASGGGDISLTIGNATSSLGNAALRAINAGTGDIAIVARQGSILEQTVNASNLAGANIQLRAGEQTPGTTAIGASGSEINLSSAATNLDAQAGSGGIFLDSSGAVTVTDLNTTPDGNGLLVTGAGNIQLDADSSLTVSADVETQDGTITLRADANGSAAGAFNQTTGTIISDSDLLNPGQGNTITITGSNVTALSGVVNSDSGNIFIRPTTDVALGVGGTTGSLPTGTFTLRESDLRNIVTNGGTIEVGFAGGAAAVDIQDLNLLVNTGATGPDGNLTVRGGAMAMKLVTLSNNRTLSLISAGAITDNNDTTGNPVNVTISGGTVILNSQTGVGASTNALEINVANLAAQAATSGGIYLSESDDLNVQNLGGIAGLVTGDGNLNVQVGRDLVIQNGLDVIPGGAGNTVTFVSTGPGAFTMDDTRRIETQSGAVLLDFDQFVGSNGAFGRIDTTGNTTTGANVQVLFSGNVTFQNSRIGTPDVPAAITTGTADPTVNAGGSIGINGVVTGNDITLRSGVNLSIYNPFLAGTDPDVVVDATGALNMEATTGDIVLADPANDILRSTAARASLSDGVAIKLRGGGAGDLGNLDTSQGNGDITLTFLTAGGGNLALDASTIGDLPGDLRVYRIATGAGLDVYGDLNINQTGIGGSRLFFEGAVDVRDLNARTIGHVRTQGNITTHLDTSGTVTKGNLELISTNGSLIINNPLTVQGEQLTLSSFYNLRIGDQLDPDGASGPLPTAGIAAANIVTAAELDVTFSSTGEVSGEGLGTETAGLVLLTAALEWNSLNVTGNTGVVVLANQSVDEGNIILTATEGDVRTVDDDNSGGLLPGPYSELEARAGLIRINATGTGGSSFGQTNNASVFLATIKAADGVTIQASGDLDIRGTIEGLQTGPTDPQIGGNVILNASAILSSVGLAINNAVAVNLNATSLAVNNGNFEISAAGVITALVTNGITVGQGNDLIWTTSAPGSSTGAINLGATALGVSGDSIILTASDRTGNIVSTGDKAAGLVDLKTGADLTIGTGGFEGLQGTVDMDLTVRSTNGVVTLGAPVAGGTFTWNSLTVTSEGQDASGRGILVTADQATDSGDILLTTPLKTADTDPGGIVTSAALSAVGTLTLRTQEPGTDISASSLTGTGLSLEAADSINFTNAVLDGRATGDVNLTANTLATTGGVTIQNTRNVTFTLTTPTITVSGGDFAISANGLIDVHTITSTTVTGGSLNWVSRLTGDAILIDSNDLLADNITLTTTHDQGTFRITDGTLGVNADGGDVTITTRTGQTYGTTAGDIHLGGTTTFIDLTATSQAKEITFRDANLSLNSIVARAAVGTSTTDPVVITASVDLSADNGPISLTTSGIGQDISVRSLSGTGITVTPTDDLTLSGTLSANGGAIVLGEQRVADHGDITVNGALNITNASGLTLSNSGNVTVSTGSFTADIAGPIDASTPALVDVQASNGSLSWVAQSTITAPRITTNGGAITLTPGAGQNLTLSGNLDATSGGNVSLGETGAGDGNIVISSNGFAISNAGDVTLANSGTLAITGGAFSISNASGTIDASSPASISVTGADLTWATSANRSSSISFGSNNLSANNISLTASGAGGSIVNTDGTLTVATGGTVTLSQNAALTIGTGTASVADEIQNPVDVNLVATSSSNGLTFSDSAVTWNTLTGTGATGLSASVNLITGSGAINLSTTVAGSDISVQSLTGAGGVTVVPMRDLILASTVDAGGQAVLLGAAGAGNVTATTSGLTIQNASTVNVQNTGTVTVGGGALAISSGITSTITVPAITSQGGSITLTPGAGQNLALRGAIDGGGGAVSLGETGTGNGNIVATTAGLMIQNAGDVTFGNSGDVDVNNGNFTVVSSGTISATTPTVVDILGAATNVDWTAQTINANGLTTQGGNITLTPGAGQDLALNLNGGALDAGGGGTITLGQAGSGDITASTALSFLNAGTVTLGNSGIFTAASGGLTINLGAGTINAAVPSQVLVQGGNALNWTAGTITVGSATTVGADINLTAAAGQDLNLTVTGALNTGTSGTVKLGNAAVNITMPSGLNITSTTDVSFLNNGDLIVQSGQSLTIDTDGQIDAAGTQNPDNIVFQDTAGDGVFGSLSLISRAQGVAIRLGTAADDPNPGDPADPVNLANAQNITLRAPNGNLDIENVSNLDPRDGGTIDLAQSGAFNVSTFQVDGNDITFRVESTGDAVNLGIGGNLLTFTGNNSSLYATASGNVALGDGFDLLNAKHIELDSSGASITGTARLGVADAEKQIVLRQTGVQNLGSTGADRIQFGGTVQDIALSVSSGAINVTGALDLNSIALSTTTGDLDLGNNNLSSTRDMSLSVTGSIVNGNSTLQVGDNQNLTIRQPGALVIGTGGIAAIQDASGGDADGVNLTVESTGGSVTLNAVGGGVFNSVNATAASDITVGATLTTDSGALDLTAGANIQTGNLTGSGTLNLTAGADIRTGSLAGSGALNLTAGAEIQAGNFTGSALSLTAGTDIQTGNLSGSGALNLTAGADIQAGNFTGSALSLTAGADIQAGTLSGSGALSLTAGANIQAASLTGVGVTLTGSAITLASTIDAEAAGVQLAANTLNATTNGLNIRDSSSVQLRVGTVNISGGDFTINDGITGAIDASTGTNAISVQGTNSLNWQTIGTGGINYGSADISANSITMNATSIAQAANGSLAVSSEGGDINLTQAGDLTIGTGGVQLGGTTGYIDLTASSGANVALASALTTNSLNVTGTAVTVGGDQTTDSGALNLTAGAGSVDAGGHSLIASNGALNVRVTSSSGNLTAGDLQGNSVTAYAGSNGTITLSSNVNGGNGAVGFDGAALVAVVDGLRISDASSVSFGNIRTMRIAGGDLTIDTPGALSSAAGGLSVDAGNRAQLTAGTLSDFASISADSGLTVSAGSIFSRTGDTTLSGVNGALTLSGLFDVNGRLTLRGRTYNLSQATFGPNAILDVTLPSRAVDIQGTNIQTSSTGETPLPDVVTGEGVQGLEPGEIVTLQRSPERDAAVRSALRNLLGEDVELDPAIAALFDIHPSMLDGSTLDSYSEAGIGDSLTALVLRLDTLDAVLSSAELLTAMAEKVEADPSTLGGLIIEHPWLRAARDVIQDAPVLMLKLGLDASQTLELLRKHYLSLKETHPKTYAALEQMFRDELEEEE